MDSSDIQKRSRFDRVKFSIGLTAVAVIILILLLALTVRHAREKEMVRQFGLQQAAIARGTAARLENLLTSVERYLQLLAAEPAKNLGDEKRIREVHEMIGGKISFAVVMDENGAVLMRYPPPQPGQQGRYAGESSLLLRIREMGKQTTNSVLLPAGEGKGQRIMAICVPRFGVKGGFAGAAIFVFVLLSIKDHQRKKRGGG
jgi:hypothetical protein